MASDHDQVKLLGTWASPFVIRARVALNIKRVKHEFIEESIFDAKSDLLLKSNPVYKKIPVLIHGGRTVCESLIIVQYLDEVWASGHAILPSDPLDRAAARFWAAYIDDKWSRNLRATLMADGDAAKMAAEQAIEGLALLEDAFTKCSKGRNFFGGENIGYLDIALGCLLPWVRVVHKMAGVDVINASNTPKLFKWAQDFMADDAIKDILPGDDEFLQFAAMLVARFKPAPQR